MPRNDPNGATSASSWVCLAMVRTARRRRRRSRHCALFEESEHHEFVDALLAAFEYAAFVRLMAKGGGGGDHK